MAAPGYLPAIRAAQLGAKTACIEKEPELGGTCLRIGCILTKAWVQTAFAIKEAHESFAKFGVNVGEPQLDIGVANQWKDGVVKQMTGGVASLFKANGVEWVKGTGRFKDANTIAVEGGEDVNFKQAIIATGSFPLRPPIEGLDSPRASTRPACSRQSEVPRRLSLGGGSSASSSRRSSSASAAKRRSSRCCRASSRSRTRTRRRSSRSSSSDGTSRCTSRSSARRSRTTLAAHGPLRRRRDRPGRPDARRRRRGPVVENLGLAEIGVEFDPRKGIAADEHRRTTVDHIYAVGDCAGYWQLAHTAFREGEVAAENACGHDAVVDNRAVPRPIYTDPEVASVGLTEAERSSTATTLRLGSLVGRKRARSARRTSTIGWSSRSTRRATASCSASMVGPHVTDLIAASSRSTPSRRSTWSPTGMTAHPTLSEAVKEAGLVALGRAIHLPNRARARPGVGTCRNGRSARAAGPFSLCPRGYDALRPSTDR